MRRGRWGMGMLLALALVMNAFVPLLPRTLAQNQATTVVARGLTTPGGFTWNANDVLFVALTGSGGDEIVRPEAPAPLGPLTFGQTGAVAMITDGCPRPLATGIVSIRTPQNQIAGVQAVAELNGQLYVLISNAGDPDGDYDPVSGVYRLSGNGSLTSIADHTAFLQSNPPASEPVAGFPNPGHPVSMIAADNALWIADRTNGLISKVIPGEPETLVIDLAEQGWFPTELAFGSGGTLYASVVGQTPPEPETGAVVQISTGGDVQLVWSGLTAPSGITLTNDGTLYATELAVNAQAGTGRLVRQNNDGLEIVVDGLDFPAALGTGPDGAVYFATGGAESDDGSGAIVRYAPDGSNVSAAPIDCEPIAETLGGIRNQTPELGSPPEPSVTPTPVGTSTPTPIPTPTVPWIPDNAAPTGEVVEVELVDYGIDMPTQLTAGPVTFIITNTGSLSHGFSIEGPGVDLALTRELEPGDEGVLSIELQPGRYTVSSPSLGDRENGMVLTVDVP